MSITSQRIARRAVLLAAALFAATVCVRAQSPQYNWRSVQIYGGGFISGLVFSQTEPNLVYARTDIGGAYRLDPSTNRWVPLLDSIGWDDWNLTGVVSVATDPVSPNNVYAAVGTYTNDWTSQNGAVLRSADRGATWQRTMLPFKLGGNMPGRGAGERLAVDPNRNSTLYLGAPSGNGLWRSTDSGVTWSKVTSFPAAGSYVQDPADPNGYLNDNQGVYWVTFDKRTGSAGNATQTIYVGVADLGTSVYRSTDGGKTFVSTAAAGLPLNGPVRFKAVPGREGDIWLAGGGVGQHVRPLALDRLGRELRQARQRRGGRQHRLRQGRGGSDLRGFVFGRAGRGRARHLPLG